MYDLLIKGGRVIDPAQNIDGKLDIAITGDKIAILAKDIPAQKGQQVIDASEKLVTPGLIDLHCHVPGALRTHIANGILKSHIEPDIAGVNQGVTTVVDGGSTGQATFGGFAQYVVPPARSRVFCFLNLSSQGQTVTPELRDWDEINLEATALTIEAYRELIKGMKVRLVGKLMASHGTEVFKTASKVARQCGIPIMLHIGDLKEQVSPTLTQETLPLMKPGDILSHAFTIKYGGVIHPDGTGFSELKEAKERGVILDICVGRFNLSFEVARKCMDQGIFPTTLSTDVSIASLKGPVYGMAVTMSKFAGLGLDLKQIVEMSTINPARALGEENRIGSLKPGMEADVSILELISGKWIFDDSEKQTIEVDRLITPSVTVKAGQVIPANPASQPQPVDGTGAKDKK
ncbi:amidohydrolase/deacetylase family metallohydrolase [Chloroflexota bacterium]